jgi:hypothetical protein
MGGLRFEVWTLPWSATFERVIADLPAVTGSASGTVKLNDFASGSVGVPSGYDRLSDIVGTATGRMIRVFDGSTLIHEYVAERVSHQIDSEAGSVAMISGPDLASAAFDGTVVFPWDYTKNPSLFPDWVFQHGRDSLSNTTFDTTGTPEKQQYHLHAASGNYTITVPSYGTTGNLQPYEAGGRASDVKTALEAVAGITEVNVTGRGHTENDPLVIEFVDPLGNIGQITINDVSLVTAGCANPPCHAPVVSTLTNGTLSVAPWTKTQTVDGVVIPAVHGVVTSLTVGSDTPNYLIVDGAISNAGAQQIVNVNPGAPMGASFQVWTTSATDEFFISVFGTNEKVLGTMTPVTVTPSTWTRITLPTFTLPDVIQDNQVILRVQVSSGASAPADFRIRIIDGTDGFFVGLGVATIGDIVTQLMDDAAVDHAADTRGTTLDWVDYSGFDATNDSNTVAWATSEGITINRGTSYGQVFDRIRGMGYEFSLTAKASPGATTHDLNLYPADGLGADYTSAATPAVNVGQGPVSGSIVQHIPRYTAALVEGSDGNWVEATNSTPLTNFGRIERYQGDTRLNSTISITAASSHMLSLEESVQSTVNVRIVRDDRFPVPLVDYTVGDLLVSQFPPVVTKANARVVLISYVNSEPVAYQVQLVFV